MGSQLHVVKLSKKKYPRKYQDFFTNFIDFDKIHKFEVLNGGFDARSLRDIPTHPTSKHNGFSINFSIWFTYVSQPSLGMFHRRMRKLIYN
jgi:hypothetical protein